MTATTIVTAVNDYQVTVLLDGESRRLTWPALRDAASDRNSDVECRAAYASMLAAAESLRAGQIAVTIRTARKDGPPEAVDSDIEGRSYAAGGWYCEHWIARDHGTVAGPTANAPVIAEHRADPWPLTYPTRELAESRAAAECRRRFPGAMIEFAR
jgi:hypothetical protein